MSSSSSNYSKTAITVLLAGAAGILAYEAMQKNQAPPVDPGTPPIRLITPIAPPAGVVASFSRSLIINNFVSYLFGPPGGYALLIKGGGFPSADNINANGYDTASLTIQPNAGLSFGPFPSGYYYMPKVNVSLMVGFPLLSTPPSYPPMGTFVSGIPFITPPDGALVGLAASTPPANWGGQYYQASPPLTGVAPQDGFSTTLGLWARFSVVAWNILSVNPATNTSMPAWVLNSDSGTQVSWSP